VSARPVTVSPLALLILIFAIIGGIAYAISLFHQPPTTQEVLAKQKVAIIGDSLTEQNGKGISNLEAIYGKAGFKAQNLYMYGVDGKQIAAPDKYGITTVENIGEARTKLKNVNVWLIALGTNDRNKPTNDVSADVDMIMKKIGSKGRVLWVNTSSRDSSYESMAHTNAAIKKVLANYSNATYLDWDSYIHMAGDKTSWLSATSVKDPIHMNADGYQIRNAFYLYRTAAAADKSIAQ